MVVVGVLYLIFEDRLMADFSSSKTPKRFQKGNEISRALIGVQVGIFSSISHRTLLIFSRSDSSFWLCW